MRKIKTFLTDSQPGYVLSMFLSQPERSYKKGSYKKKRVYPSDIH